MRDDLVFLVFYGEQYIIDYLHRLIIISNENRLTSKYIIFDKSFRFIILTFKNCFPEKTILYILVFLFIFYNDDNVLICISKFYIECVCL